MPSSNVQCSTRIRTCVQVELRGDGHPNPAIVANFVPRFHIRRPVTSKFKFQQQLDT